MPSNLAVRLSLLLLASVLTSACGNKGDLFLPASLDDERRLQRIDDGLPETVDPAGPADPTAPERDPATGAAGTRRGAGS